MIPLRTLHFRLLAGIKAAVRDGQGTGPMEKKKLEGFKKRLEDRQRELRHAMNRTAQDGRDADLESAQDIRSRGKFLQQGILVPSEQQRSSTAADGGRGARPHS